AFRARADEPARGAGTRGGGPARLLPVSHCRRLTRRWPHVAQPLRRPRDDADGRGRLRQSDVHHTIDDGPHGGDRRWLPAHHAVLPGTDHARGGRRHHRVHEGALARTRPAPGGRNRAGRRHRTSTRRHADAPAGPQPALPPRPQPADHGAVEAARSPTTRTSGAGGAMSTTATAPRPPGTPAARRANYLDVETTVRSWLGTPAHKRTGILLLPSTTLSLALGRRLALARRLGRLPSEPIFIDHLIYYILLTLHGLVILWPSIIHAIPTVFRNFIFPLMIGARDVAFP